MAEELLSPKIENHGLFATHNMPCSICRQAPAVYDCNQDYFQPCWRCQEQGWVTCQQSNFLKWLRTWFS